MNFGFCYPIFYKAIFEAIQFKTFKLKQSQEGHHEISIKS